MVEVIALGRQHGYDRVQNCIEKSACVRLLRFRSHSLSATPKPVRPAQAGSSAFPEWLEYDRPLPNYCDYDRLLSVAEVRA